MSCRSVKSWRSSRPIISACFTASGPTSRRGSTCEIRSTANWSVCLRIGYNSASNSTYNHTWFNSLLQGLLRFLLSFLNLLIDWLPISARNCPLVLVLTDAWKLNSSSASPSAINVLPDLGAMILNFIYLLTLKQNLSVFFWNLVQKIPNWYGHLHLYL